MAKFKRILVTTDFSDAGNKAVDDAFELAADMGAHVALLTVLERDPRTARYFIDYTPMESEDHINKAKDQAREKLLALVPDALKSKVSHEVVPFVADSPWKGILEAVKNFGADLLVISDHGMSALEKLVLGSTADRVLRSVDIPVLLIKD